LMAPRVDRTVARVSPPGGGSPAPSARMRSEAASDLERTPNPFVIRSPEFLSLFKGQGAAARDDFASSNGKLFPRRAISSAG
jgi:hypothetical protein